jgi:hypothetical protein
MADLDININIDGTGGIDDANKKLDNLGKTAEKTTEHVGGMRKELRAVGETSKAAGGALDGMGGALGGIGEGSKIAFAGFELMNGGLKELAVTIMANPIFLLAAVIAGVVVAMIDLNKENKEAIKGWKEAEKEIEKFGESLGKVDDDRLDAQDKLAVAQHKMSQEQADLNKNQRDGATALKKQTEENTKVLGNAIAAASKLKKGSKEQIEADGKLAALDKAIKIKDVELTATSEAEKLTIIQDAENDAADLKKKNADKNAKLFAKSIAEAEKEKQRLAKEEAKTAEENTKTYDELEKEKLKGEREITESTLNEFDKRKAKSNDTYTDEIKKLQDLLDAKKIDESDFIEFQAAAEKTKNGEIDKINKDQYAKSFKEREEALKSAGDEAVAAAGDDEEKILAVQLEYLTKEHDLAVEAAEAKGESTVAIDAKYQAELVKNAEKTAKKKKKIKEEEEKSTLDIANETVDSLNSLEDVVFSIKDANLKKGSAAALAAAQRDFKVKKALSITSAVISGIEGVLNALTAQSALPEPYAEILRVATAVATGVAAAANVAKIASTQFNAGASSGGGGGASIPQPATPTFNPQSLQRIGGTNAPSTTKPGVTKPGATPGPQKIYVVSTDITNSQNKDAVLSRRASFK